MRLRKILPVIILGLVIGLLALPQIGEWGARRALSPAYRGQAWAPGVVYWAARANMRLWHYQTAGALFEQGLYAFPNAYWRRQGTFYIGLCCERQGESANAVRWYQTFLRQYPDDPWGVQAQHRISNLEANE